MGKKKIITSVGTSLVDHLLKQEEVPPDITKILDQGIEEEEKYDLDIFNFKDKALDYLKKMDFFNNDHLQYMPAELKSLSKIIRKEDLSQVDIHLIYTDTLAGKIVAGVLGEYLVDLEHIDRVDKEKIDDLKVDNAEDFEKFGIQNLIEKINEISTNTYQGNLILNITGGYKAVVPYITLIGLVNDLSVYYIFEDTEQLIKLPALPVDMDYSFFDDYKKVIYKIVKEDTFTANRLEKIFDSEGIDHATREVIKEKLITDYEGCNIVNPIAKIFWDNFSKDYLFNIALSKEAKEFYEKNRKRATEILKDVSDYQYRNSESHYHNLDRTNLECCKKEARTDKSFRVMYSVEDKTDEEAMVKVAEIYKGHTPRYEKDFLNNPEPNNIEDYKYEWVVIPLDTEE